MNDVIIDVLLWVLGGVGALLIFLFSLWWKIEARQDKKIEHLSESNGREHRELHEKIDSNHHAIRDKLDTIWKHIKNGR